MDEGDEELIRLLSSVKLTCDNCGALDNLMDMTVSDGDTSWDESWCPPCVAEATAEVADAIDIDGPASSGDGRG